MDAVEAALEAVASRRPPLIDLGLGRILRVLSRLDDPQLKLPPFFHVAGTNGKGSVVSYLRAVLEADGARVHSYISPHLVRYSERITLAGKAIEDEAFVEAIGRVDRAAGEDDLTLFETMTAAAFIAFSETPADFLILEVGLGGRLDATNVVDRPLAAIVTPVGLDHQHFLGDTIELIAREKAGVFRAGAPAVIGLQTPEAMAVLESEAARIGGAPHIFGSDWNAWAENGRLIYQDENGLSDLAPPGLAGAHQFPNAGLAVAALKAARLPISDDVISKGLKAARWPARLQRLISGPLFDILNDDPGVELWLDGGHNPHAAVALAAAMGEFEEKRPKPLLLIAGMQENKDSEGFFAPFAGLAFEVFTVMARHSGARDAPSLAAAAMRAGLAAKACDTVEEAAARARRVAPGPKRVLICGSLYLAGEILKSHA